LIFYRRVFNEGQEQYCPFVQRAALSSGSFARPRRAEPTIASETTFLFSHHFSRRFPRLSKAPWEREQRAKCPNTTINGVSPVLNLAGNNDTDMGSFNYQTKRNSSLTNSK
jgi:hypothetical protein